MNSVAKTDEDGIVSVPAFDLPLSEFLSDETRAVLKRQAEDDAAFAQACPLKQKWSELANQDEVLVFRQCLQKHTVALINRYQARYKVSLRQQTIAQVPSDVFTPAEGVSAANRARVLINLHGGAFMWGGRDSGGAGQVESIPISALAKIKVVSIEYRMAPEYRFPAASEDVAAVYQALLKDYRPENIGIYGCSAGGFLTAQAVAWLQKQGLPRPGAIGMFCAGAFPSGGDSQYLGAAISGVRSSTSAASSKSIYYLNKEDLNDPLAFPGLAPEVMARFPASLLISSTRDFNMSSVVLTHAQLVRLGVRANLHIWEGLGHGFFYEPDLFESPEVYEVIARFFNEHLGPAQSGNKYATVDSICQER